MGEPDNTGAIDWRGGPLSPDQPLTSTHWADGSDVWTYVEIGGDITPGIASIKGLKKGQKIDNKSAKGKKGGSLTISGPEKPEFTIELILVTEEHW